MEEENKDVAEVQETSQENLDSQTEEVDVEDLKKKAEVSSQNFERAKKAEEEVKKLKAQLDSKVSISDKEGLSTKDIIFLGKADIHEDDMDEVLERAKNKKIPVSEAYKQLKPLLDAHAEERKSAEVANTSNARRGSSKLDGATLISQARSGKLPEKDEDIRAALEARMKQK